MDLMLQPKEEGKGGGLGSSISKIGLASMDNGTNFPSILVPDRSEYGKQDLFI